MMDHESENDRDATESAAAEAARSMDAIYDKARVARDKLNAVLTDLGSKAEHAEQQVRRGVAETETQIKQHPFAAVALAAGLGVVIGLLLNRRR